MRRRLAMVMGTWLVSAAWLGCSLILGNESAVFAPSEAEAGDATSGGDGSTIGDSSSRDVASDAEEDAGPCTNVETNPKHCGRCFHDCRGGSCIDGICQPVTLVTETGRPGPIAIDGTHVYWANRRSGNIARVPIAGGTPELIYDGPEDTTPGEEIAVYDGHVYFTSNVSDGGVLRCPVTGCTNGEPEVVVPNLESPDFVSVSDAGELVFAEAAFNGRVGRCKLPCTGPFETIASAEGIPQRVAVEGETIVWTNVVPAAIRVKTGDDEPRTISVLNAYGIALAGSEIIYARLDQGPMAVLLDGGSPRRVVAAQTSQTDYIVVRGPDVFWADTRSSSRVLSCPIGGCEAGVVHATGQAAPRSIAVDENNIYWTNEGSTVDTTGQVMRVAR